jgi:glutamine amidotransferase
MATARSVTVVDYGRGNLLSVARALEHCGATVTFADEPGPVTAAERLVLPGVGAFGDAMAELARRGLDEAIHAFAATGRPFLGICLGMQLLLDVSEEFGAHGGLGLVPGAVTAVPASGADGRPHRVPHIGWNALHPANGGWDGTVLGGVAPGSSVYFVHSFAAHPDSESDRLADCDYDGVRIAAAIRRGAWTGCQFHPEKSGPVGLRIIENFVESRKATS